MYRQWASRYDGNIDPCDFVAETSKDVALLLLALPSGANMIGILLFASSLLLTQLPAIEHLNLALPLAQDNVTKERIYTRIGYFQSIAAALRQLQSRSAAIAGYRTPPHRPQ